MKEFSPTPGFADLSKEEIDRRMKASKDTKTLRFEKSDSLENWYHIVRGVKDGDLLLGFYHEGNCSNFYVSNRVADACVEGPLEDMRAIALAILNKTDESQYRCAVQFSKDLTKVGFYSPRNSQDWDIEFSYEEAEKLAIHILSI